MTSQPKEVELNDVNREAVTRVALNVELANVQMTWLNAELNADADSLPAGWSSEAMIGFSSSLKSDSISKGTFVVAASFIAGYKEEWVEKGRPDHLGDDPADIEIATTFELQYRIKDRSSLRNEDLEHFAVLNGTFNAWPYWRELAQSTSMRMGVPPLIVKVFVLPTPPGIENSD